MTALPNARSGLPGRPSRPSSAAIAGSLRDVTLGGQDGLVNVLGLVLGMAAATGDVRVILTAGLAAMMAESIAMAGVAFTAGGTERDWMRAQGGELRAHMDAQSAERLAGAIGDLPPGAPADMSDRIRRAVAQERELRHQQTDRQRAELAPVRERRPVAMALLVGVSTLLGSAIPMLPFLVLPVATAAAVALGISGATLFIAGVVRSRVTGTSALRAGTVMAAIGLLSAAAGYVIGLLLRAPSPA